MKVKLIFGGLFNVLLLSEVMASSINYVNCRDKVGNAYIDKTGRLVPTPPYDILKTTIKDNQEIIELGCDKSECEKHTVYLNKNDKGELIGWLTGKPTLTKDELEERKKGDMKSLETMFFYSSPDEMPFTLLNFKDEAGKIKTLNFDTLNEKEFNSFGLNKEISFKEFKDYRTLPSSYPDLEDKMNKAFQQMLKNKKRFYTEHAKGVHFEIKDNTCYHKMSYGLATSHGSGAKEDEGHFDTDKCSELVQLYKQYNKELMQCDGINNEISMILGDNLQENPIGINKWDVPTMKPALYKMVKYCQRLKEIEPLKGMKNSKGSSKSTKQ